MITRVNLLGLGLVLALFSTPNSLSTAFAQGSLTPPGAPAPTMKSLAQVEPRIPISSVPYTVNLPGAYYLTTNVTTYTSNAIVISASGVTLDLGGWTIYSTVAASANGGTAILIGSSLRDITICNGHICGGVTNNGSGVYNGSGFGYGISFSGNAPVNVLVSRVSVSGCLYYGIYFTKLDSQAVESCTVRTVGSFGIISSTVKDSSAIDCGGGGITANTAENCLGSSSIGDGIVASTALNCFGFSNGSSGEGVAATTALNCYGSSQGDGIDATTAENCSGSSASSFGVNATIAENCSGVSNYGSNGAGIYASSALNCRGYNYGDGYGVQADIAQDCWGRSSGSGYGVYATYLANGCYGYSASGTGVYAFVASLCHAATSTGVTLSTLHNVNSY